MKIIGLLGGVASGKSFVAQAMVRRGAVWLDADKFGHEVLRDGDVIRAVVARWGASVLKTQGGTSQSPSDGRGNKMESKLPRPSPEAQSVPPAGTLQELDRTAIAKIVFEESAHGAAELRWLEQLSHPRIRAKLEQRISELRAENCPMVIMDAPVMLKTGWDKICDRVIYVHATKEVRLKRALARGWSKEQFEKREAAQETLEVKRARADFVLDNSGDSEYTEKQLDQLWQNLLK